MRTYFLQIEESILKGIHSANPDNEFREFLGDYRDIIDYVGKELLETQIIAFEEDYALKQKAKELDVPIKEELTEEDKERIKKEELKRDLQSKIEAIKLWFKEHDWYINKVFLGEWEESDPRYVEYLKIRKTKRDELEKIEESLMEVR